MIIIVVNNSTTPHGLAEVEKVLPGYRVQRKWLKDNGGAIIKRLPDK